MSEKKKLVILFGVVFAVAFASLVWMTGEVDKMAAQNKQQTVDIQAFCNDGLQPTPSFCKSTLKTSVSGPQPILKVETSRAMQPFGRGAEDDDTAQLHVQPTVSPQVTSYQDFVQCPMRVEGQRDLLGAKLQ